MEGSDVTAAPETRLRGRELSSDGSVGTRRGAGARVALKALVVVNAAAFLGASIVHFGVPIPLGFAVLDDATILPAGIAEGAIGVAFVVAAAAMFGRRDGAWNGALAAFVFGILGVLVGLSVTLSDAGDSSPANLVFHEAILPLLVVGLTLVLTRSGKAALGRPTIPKAARP